MTHLACVSLALTVPSRPSLLPSPDARTHADRRAAALPVALERRHGERRQYQQGCRCTPCRAANARYQAAFRLALVRGRPLPGTRIPAVKAHKLMLMLRVEWFSNGDVARLLGWHGNYGRIYHAGTVSLRTQQQLERLYQERCAS